MFFIVHASEVFFVKNTLLQSPLTSVFQKQSIRDKCVIFNVVLSKAQCTCVTFLIFPHLLKKDVHLSEEATHIANPFFIKENIMKCKV